MLGKISRALTTRGTRTLATAVAERGWPCTERVDAVDVPSTLNGSDVWFDVVEASATPRIRWGNDGHRYWVIREDGRPGRRGFIGLQHGLDLPHTLVVSSKFGAKTPTNLAAATGQFVLDVAALGDEDGGEPLGNSVGAFKDRATELDRPRKIGFRAYTVSEDAKRGQCLLTEETTPLIRDLTLSFDLELRDGWLWAHSLFGDLVTTDDDVWEWTLAETSRLVDLARLWGAGPEFGSQWAGYTSERVQRPRRLDGALSRRRWEK